MSTREVMRHPIRAALLAPLTVIPAAIFLIAIFYAFAAPDTSDGTLVFLWYAAQLFIPGIVVGYLFAGLYVVPILTAAQISNPFHVLLFAIIPVFSVGMVFDLPFGSILIAALIAVVLAFSCWWIGGRPERHTSFHADAHAAGWRDARQSH